MSKNKHPTIIAGLMLALTAFLESDVRADNIGKPKLSYELLGEITYDSISMSPSGTAILINYDKRDYCEFVTPILSWIGGLIKKRLPYKTCTWETYNKDIIKAEGMDSTIVYMPSEITQRHIWRDDKPVYFVDENGKRVIPRISYTAGGSGRRLFVIDKGVKKEVTTPELKGISNLVYDGFGRRVNLNTNGMTHLIYDIDTEERHIFWGYENETKRRHEYHLIPGEKYLVAKDYYDYDDGHKESYDRLLDTPSRLRIIDFEGNVVQDMPNWTGGRFYISRYLLVYNRFVYAKRTK